MQPEERRAIFIGSGAQQIRRSGTSKEGGKRRWRSSFGLHSDSRREYRRWANVMLQDHELLRQLLDRFECALDSRERASLFHLAMEFHETHQRFEHAGDPAPELDLERLEMEQMTELLEHLKPDGPAWNALARAWGTKLRALMEKEEQLYCGEREQVRQFAAGWPRESLECRLSLISEVREALQG